MGLAQVAAPFARALAFLFFAELVGGCGVFDPDFSSDGLAFQPGGLPIVPHGSHGDHLQPVFVASWCVHALDPCHLPNGAAGTDFLQRGHARRHGLHLPDFFGSGAIVGSVLHEPRVGHILGGGQFYGFIGFVSGATLQQFAEPRRRQNL